MSFLSIHNIENHLNSVCIPPYICCNAHFRRILGKLFCFLQYQCSMNSILHLDSALFRIVFYTPRLLLFCISALHCCILHSNSLSIIIPSFSLVSFSDFSSANFFVSIVRTNLCTLYFVANALSLASN